MSDLADIHREDNFKYTETILITLWSQPYLSEGIAKPSMSQAIMFQAIMALVQSLSITSSYPSSLWIEEDLKPLFNSLVRRLDLFHQDLSSNASSDQILWTLNGVFLTVLVLWNLSMSFMIRQNQMTINKIGNGLLFVSTKLEIRGADNFHTAKFWTRAHSDIWNRPGTDMTTE